jgi:hypothetical protein
MTKEQIALLMQRASVVITGDAKGPRVNLDCNGNLVPRQFAVFYFWKSTQTHLLAINEFSEGELWDISDPNSETRRFLAKALRDYLASKGMCSVTAGPQRAEVFSWQRISDFLGIELEEIEKQ